MSNAGALFRAKSADGCAAPIRAGLALKFRPMSETVYMRASGQLPATLPRCHALLPAAGSGSRMASERPKQYLPLAGQALILHALQTFAAVTRIDRIYVVLSPDDADWQDSWTQALAPKLRVLRCGGASRAESVRNGLQAMVAEVAPDDWVLVHDAARPCLTATAVQTLIAAVEDAGQAADGGLLALPVADTLKRADEAQRVHGTVARSGLWQAQTPQMFPCQVLLAALQAASDLARITDEASAIEALGGRPLLVPSTASNFKVTYPADLQLAEWILQQRRKDLP